MCYASKLHVGWTILITELSLNQNFQIEKRFLARTALPWYAFQHLLLVHLPQLLLIRVNAFDLAEKTGFIQKRWSEIDFPVKPFASRFSCVVLVVCCCWRISALVSCFGRFPLGGIRLRECVKRNEVKNVGEINIHNHKIIFA